MTQHINPSPTLRARLRELARHATQGPWAVEIGLVDEEVTVWNADDALQSVCSTGNASVRQSHQDAEYIAAASPDAVLALLDALDAAERDVDPASRPTPHPECVARYCCGGKDGRPCYDKLSPKARTELQEFAARLPHTREADMSAKVELFAAQMRGEKPMTAPAFDLDAELRGISSSNNDADRAAASGLFDREAKADRRARDHASRIRSELERLRESASGGWEVLQMIHERLAAFLGEEHMEGVPPMFYNDAIRSVAYRAAFGKLPEEMYPDGSLLHRLRDAEAGAERLRSQVELWKRRARQHFDTAGALRSKVETRRDDTMDQFVGFIGSGANSRGAFPTTLTELNADAQEFARALLSASSPQQEQP